MQRDGENEMFKTWNSDGTAATYHRTAVVNFAAQTMGAKAAEMAAKWLKSERVTGVQAMEALDFAAAF